jgi:hypothetical protein
MSAVLLTPALRTTPEGLDARWRAIHKEALDIDDTALNGALHDLRDIEVTPGPQAGHTRWGQHVAVGSRTVLLALLGSMSGEVCRNPHLLYKPTSPWFNGELPDVIRPP